jgi:hypothetical protein
MNLEDIYAAMDQDNDPWESAECRQYDPELWWGWDERLTGGHPSNDLIDNTRFALTVCNRCPIRMKCLELGMNEQHISHGIFGGLFAGERIGTIRNRKGINDLRALEKAQRFRRLTQVPMTQEETKWVS